MKQNNGCVLEKWVDGRWIPVAMRYQHFTPGERRAQDRGDEVCRDGAAWRRWDWADRRALAKIFLEKD